MQLFGITLIVSLAPLNLHYGERVYGGAYPTGPVWSEEWSS
jgi:hypothetical protein